MKNIWTKITITGTIIAAAVFAVFRFLLVPAKKNEQEFPGAKEKQELEQDIKKTEQELTEVEKKEYTQDEIEKKFNE
jgi:hypothetical protein